MRWFARPGMVVALLGYLFAIAASCAWLCRCGGKRFELAKRQKVCAIAVFFAGGLQMLGWSLMLGDTSLAAKMDENATSTEGLPEGIAPGEKMHGTRWWFGMLCGPFFWIFGAMVWVYQGEVEDLGSVGLPAEA